MRLGIPLKGDIISPSNEADRFVRINLKDGKIDSIDEFDSRDSLVGEVDFFITPQEEYVFDFLNMGAEPLLTPTTMNIEEIVSAFLFRELYSYASI
jgi:excinuclease UvrABC helicase subunit UvrB